MLNIEKYESETEKNEPNFKNIILIILLCIFLIYLCCYEFFENKLLPFPLVEIFVIVIIISICILLNRIKFNDDQNEEFNYQKPESWNHHQIFKKIPHPEENLESFGFSENILNEAKSLLKVQKFENSYFSKKKPNYRTSQKASYADTNNQNNSILNTVNINWTKKKKEEIQKNPKILKNTFTPKQDEIRQRKTTSRLSTRNKAILSKKRPTQIKTISRYSISRNRNTVARSSIMSKYGNHKDNLFNIDEGDEIQKKMKMVLFSKNIDLKSFNMWSYHNIQIWLAFNFIPEIFNLNFENLRKINFCLNSFKINLKDFNIIKEFIQENRTMDYNHPVLPLYFKNKENAKIEKVMNLNELLTLDIFSIFRYGSNWGLNEFNSPNELKIKLMELDDLLNERALLDSYFNFEEYSIDKTRIYLLKKLFKMQKKNFIEEIDNDYYVDQKFYPSVENILLHLFVNNLKNLDKFYSQNKTSIFLNPYLSYIKKDEKDFYIQKSGFHNYVVFMGNDKFSCFCDLQGVFNIMVFFVFHVKKYHWDYIKYLKKKDNAFGELFSIFKIDK